MENNDADCVYMYLIISLNDKQIMQERWRQREFNYFPRNLLSCNKYTVLRAKCLIGLVTIMFVGLNHHQSNKTSMSEHIGLSMFHFIKALCFRAENEHIFSLKYIQYMNFKRVIKNWMQLFHFYHYRVLFLAVCSFYPLCRHWNSVYYIKRSQIHWACLTWSLDY